MARKLTAKQSASKGFNNVRWYAVFGKDELRALSRQKSPIEVGEREVANSSAKSRIGISYFHAHPHDSSHSTWYNLPSASFTIIARCSPIREQPSSSARRAGSARCALRIIAPCSSCDALKPEIACPRRSAQDSAIFAVSDRPFFRCVPKIARIQLSLSRLLT